MNKKKRQTIWSMYKCQSLALIFFLLAHGILIAQEPSNALEDISKRFKGQLIGPESAREILLDQIKSKKEKVQAKLIKDLFSSQSDYIVENALRGVWDEDHKIYSEFSVINSSSLVYDALKNLVNRSSSEPQSLYEKEVEVSAIELLFNIQSSENIINFIEKTIDNQGHRALCISGMWIAAIQWKIENKGKKLPLNVFYGNIDDKKIDNISEKDLVETGNKILNRLSDKLSALFYSEKIIFYGFPEFLVLKPFSDQKSDKNALKLCSVFLKRMGHFVNMHMILPDVIKRLLMIQDQGMVRKKMKNLSSGFSLVQTKLILYYIYKNKSTGDEKDVRMLINILKEEKEEVRQTVQKLDEGRISTETKSNWFKEFKENKLYPIIDEVFRKND